MPDLPPAELAALGFSDALTDGDVEALVDAVHGHGDPAARVVALGALVRQIGTVEAGHVHRAWRSAVGDASAQVRRRAAEVAPAVAASGLGVTADLGRLLDADAPLVAEVAAFALGELADVPTDALDLLARMAREHDDPLVREACVAALGAQGEPHTLPAVLDALKDRPQVRRRAVLALAAFDGPEVEHALHSSLEDRDWQVRQAAEDLLA